MIFLMTILKILSRSPIIHLLKYFPHSVDLGQGDQSNSGDYLIS